MELNTPAGGLPIDQEYYLTREEIEDLKQDLRCGEEFYILKVDENNPLTVKHDDILNNGLQMKTVDVSMETIETSMNTNSSTKQRVYSKQREIYDERFPFRCKFCSACFTQKKSLTSHNIYSHKNNKSVNSNVIFCPLCSYLTLDQKFMDKHMLTHNKDKSKNNTNSHSLEAKQEPEPLFFCNKCSFSCKIEETFKKHKDLHESLERFQLSKMKALGHHPSASNISPYSQFKPQTLTVKEEVVIPDIADMEPSTSNNVKEDENLQIISVIQLEVEPTHFFKCKECDFTSSDLTQLKSHQKEIHSGYKCQQCEVVFESNAHLKQHQQIHIHNFECNLCGQEFALLKDLKAHHKIHANRNKYFYCSICGFMSFGEKEIRNHFPCLSENVCQKCKMKFKHPLSLKKHIEENHGTFQCDECGYMVVDKKKDFINHIKQHEDEKNGSITKEAPWYQCFECNKGFKVRNRLSEHLRTHGIYTCHTCDSSFFSIRDLKLHAFTHEEKVTTYLCEQCGLKCPTKYDLSNHVLTHNITPNNYQV